MNALPYWRLSAFYFFYLALLGGFMPYWSLYLVRQLHFTPALIGQLMLITVVTRVIAPNFWGHIADSTGKRLLLVRLGTLMLLLIWCILFRLRTFSAIAVMLLLYSFFQNAILAQFEALTIAHLGSRREHYGRIRVWGSLGFIFAVTGLGYLFGRISLAWLPVLLALIALAALLSSLSVPEAGTPKSGHAHTPLWAILKRRPVIGFLGASFLLQVSHAPYYTFYSIFLEAHHYSRASIGCFWALGAAAEVAAFTQMHRILPVLGERQVLLASLLLTALRWLLIGLAADHPGLLAALQLLQAASFSGVHAACMGLIQRHFGHDHQGQGQAVYGMLWGLGAALGSYATGALWSGVGPELLYGYAAVVCLTALAWLWSFTRNTAVAAAPARKIAGAALAKA